jgi:hypothetical protein
VLERTYLRIVRPDGSLAMRDPQTLLLNTGAGWLYLETFASRATTDPLAAHQLLDIARRRERHGIQKIEVWRHYFVGTVHSFPYVDFDAPTRRVLLGVLIP